AFLGWAAPRDVLRALLDTDERYRVAYDRAQAIATQVMAFGRVDVSPPNFVFHPDVARYSFIPGYVELGGGVAEQILMDQLAGNHVYPGNAVAVSLEKPPDHLTPGRFVSLLGPYLYVDAIDLAWPDERQVTTLLESRAPFVALLRGGRYEGMLRGDVM